MQDGMKVLRLPVTILQLLVQDLSIRFIFLILKLPPKFSSKINILAHFPSSDLNGMKKNEITLNEMQPSASGMSCFISCTSTFYLFRNPLPIRFPAFLACWYYLHQCDSTEMERKSAIDNLSQDCRQKQYMSLVIESEKDSYED